MQVNEHILKLSGEVSLEAPLENDTDYLLALEGGIISKTEKPTGDGGIDIIYKFKPSRVITTNQKGSSVKSIDKKRNSQKFRNMINFFRKEKYPEIDEEEFYNRFMGKAMSYFEDIVLLLESRK